MLRVGKIGKLTSLQKPFKPQPPEPEGKFLFTKDGEKVKTKDDLYFKVKENVSS